ncbi:MAG: hypothetical protein ACK56I_06635, partial [bacterium]
VYGLDDKKPGPLSLNLLEIQNLSDLTGLCDSSPFAHNPLAGIVTKCPVGISKTLEKEEVTSDGFSCATPPKSGSLLHF